jgi:hypothetical protein
LKQFVGGFMRGGLNEFQLDEKGGVDSDHLAESSISSSLSSSGEGKGRSTAPTETG